MHWCTLGAWQTPEGSVLHWQPTGSLCQTVRLSDSAGSEMSYGAAVSDAPACLPVSSDQSCLTTVCSLPARLILCLLRPIFHTKVREKWVLRAGLHLPQHLNITSTAMSALSLTLPRGEMMLTATLISLLPLFWHSLWFLAKKIKSHMCAFVIKVQFVDRGSGNHISCSGVWTLHSTHKTHSNTSWMYLNIFEFVFALD